MVNIHGVNRKLFIVLVVVLFFSLFYTSGAFVWVTGKVSGFCSASCEDTDQGNIYVKGRVNFVTDNCRRDLEPKIDYCDNSRPDYLKEYKCDITTTENWKSELVYCENGCKDGACL